jgi:hypothetical protein
MATDSWQLSPGSSRWRLMFPVDLLDCVMSVVADTPTTTRPMKLTQFIQSAYFFPKILNVQCQKLLLWVETVGCGHRLWGVDIDCGVWTETVGRGRRLWGVDIDCGVWT